MLSYPDFMEKQIIWIDAWEIKKLSIQNSNLLVKDEEKTINQVSLSKIFAVFLNGNWTFTSTLIQKLIANGAILVLMNGSWRPYALIGGETEGNTLLRERQYNDQHKLEKVKWLVNNKINNQILLLKDRRSKTQKEREGLKKMKKLLIWTEKAKTAKEILGFEGNASKVFFKLYFGKFNWRWRKPRTKYDEFNTLLDIGYTYLFNFIEAHLRLYGFDIYKGFYHTEFYQRKSLVCDMVEPFRCIVDHTLYRLLALKQFDENDFYVKQGAYCLKRWHGKKYIQAFLKAIMRNKEDIFLFLQSYYRQTMKDEHNLPLFLIKK